MQVTFAEPQGCKIRLSNSLNTSNTSEFQNQMTAAIRQEQYKMVLLDMQQVESLDSTGLMALVHALRLAQALDKRFSLCSVSQSIRIIFEITQLEQVFEIIESAAAFEATLASTIIS